MTVAFTAIGFIAPVSELIPLGTSTDKIGLLQEFKMEIHFCAFSRSSPCMPVPSRASIMQSENVSAICNLFQSLSVVI